MEQNLTEKNKPWQVWPAAPWKYLRPKPDLNKGQGSWACHSGSSPQPQLLALANGASVWTLGAHWLHSQGCWTRVALILQGTAPSRPRPFLFDLQVWRRARRPHAGCLRPGPTNVRTRRLLQSLHQGGVQLLLEALQPQPGTGEWAQPPCR